MFKYLPVLLLLMAACSDEPADTSAETVSYNIDSSRISVSGVSSGAYMAGQVHLSHSAIFNGAAIVAGGPYYCAMGELARGLGPCMKGGDLDLPVLVEYARAAAAAGKIDFQISTMIVCGFSTARWIPSSPPGRFHSRRRLLHRAGFGGCRYARHGCAGSSRYGDTGLRSAMRYFWCTISERMRLRYGWRNSQDTARRFAWSHKRRR